MAGVFEASLMTVAAGPGVAYAQLQHTGSAGAARMRVKELTWTTKNATLSPVGLIRAATVGVPSGKVPGQALDDLENAVANGALYQAGVGGGNVPTIAGTPYFFREFYAAAVAGSGIPWVWPMGELTISPGGALLIWNFDVALTGSVLSLYAKWEE